MGTYSMLPREEGGVVDVSVFPLQTRNNLQTCVYAVADEAADIIKNDRKRAMGMALRMDIRGLWIKRWREEEW